MAAKLNDAYFRFYEELNDFLPPARHKTEFVYRFPGSPAIKDPIEAMGVPHTEVDLILVNGSSIGFEYRLRPNDRVSVYPVFESLDITPLVKLRERPLRTSRFVVDVNLGRLARWLRMLGFDTCYSNSYSDGDVVRTGVDQHRIILTRDRRLLHAKVITHGYWVRSNDPDGQLREVLRRFDLYSQIQPFHRCMLCNDDITAVTKEAVLDRLMPKTARYYHEFYQCHGCGRVYWKGPHYDQMLRTLDALRQDTEGPGRQQA